MKTCNRCGASKPMTEFYGRNPSCKCCVRERVRARENMLRATSPDWIQSERERCRVKQERRRASGRDASLAQFREIKQAWSLRNTHKRRANTRVAYALRSGALTRKPCEVCGDDKSEAHHEDYSRPLHVIWLCDTHHKEAHIRMREASTRLRLSNEKSVIQLNLYA